MRPLPITDNPEGVRGQLVETVETREARETRVTIPVISQAAQAGTAGRLLVRTPGSQAVVRTVSGPFSAGALQRSGGR